jgi:hypothetical protein
MVMMGNLDKEIQKHALKLVSRSHKISDTRQAEIHDYMMRMLDGKKVELLNIYVISSVLSLTKTSNQKSLLFRFCIDLFSNEDTSLRRFAIDTTSQMDLTEAQTEVLAQTIYNRVNELLENYDNSCDEELLRLIFALRLIKLSHQWCIKYLTTLSSTNSFADFNVNLSDQIRATLLSLSEQISIQNSLSLSQVVALMGVINDGDSSELGLPFDYEGFISLIRRLPPEVRVGLLNHTDHLSPAFSALIVEEIHVCADLRKHLCEQLPPDLLPNVYKYM